MPGVQSVLLGTEGWALAGPLPQLASITVAAPPGQVTVSVAVAVLLSRPIVPTSVPEPSLIATVIGPLEPVERLAPLTSIE